MRPEYTHAQPSYKHRLALQLSRVMLCLAGVLLLLLITFTVAGSLSAQDAPASDTAAEVADPDEAVVPYIQTDAYNIPLLTGWDVVPDEQFVDLRLDEQNARIIVESVETTDTAQALLQVVAARFPPLADVTPQVDEVLSLVTGQWMQRIYAGDSGTFSVLANTTRQGQTVVFVLSVMQPDGVAFVILKPSAIGVDDDTALASTVVSSLAEVVDTRLQLDAAQTRPVADAQWLLFPAESGAGADATAGGAVANRFDRTQYIGYSNGDVEQALSLATAWRRLNLGFFVTPQNSAYLWLGVGLSVAVLLSLALSIVLRYRSAREDVRVIEQLTAQAPLTAD